MFNERNWPYETAICKILTRLPPPVRYLYVGQLPAAGDDTQWWRHGSGYKLRRNSVPCPTATAIVYHEWWLSTWVFSYDNERWMGCLVLVGFTTVTSRLALHNWYTTVQHLSLNSCILFLLGAVYILNMFTRIKTRLSQKETKVLLARCYHRQVSWLLACPRLHLTLSPSSKCHL